MTDILITGATGLLGSTLAPALAALGHRVVRHGRHRVADLQADLCDADAVQRLLQAAQPQVVVHLAALTQVDACEATPDAAYRANVLAVQYLADGLARWRPHSHLVYLSTDQVYDGLGPHAEDRLKITNTYAFSKLAGELAAGRASSTVLRTNFFGPSRCDGRASLTDWLFDALCAGRTIPVFDDVLFSPVAINTLVAMIAACVEQRPAGVFNLGSRDGLSKADFAFAFADAVGLSSASLQRSASTRLASLTAYRPKDMRMDSQRFERTLGLRLPRLIDDIHQCGSLYLART